MRLLFGLLLVLSITFFALMQWGGGLTGAARNGQMLAELNPDKIRLLDRPMQMPESAVPAAQSAVAASAAAASAALAAELPAASAPLPASAPATSAVPAVPAALPAAAALKTVAPAKAAPVPPPAVPLAVPVAAPAPQAKAAARACMEWGEFSGTDLAHATKSLSSLGLGDRLQRRSVEYMSGYWVYMPPLKNKAAVNRKISQLKALGVEDYFVVHEPPKLVNVISLGVFKTHEAAQNFLASLQKKGVRSAIVGERKRKLKFIVFEFKDVEAESAAQLRKLQKDYAYSELKAVPCKK